MSPEESSQKTKICPTCGTRLAANATRCLVCGRSFAGAEPKEKKASQAPVQGPKLPAVTLSLPIAIGLVLLLLAVGAGTVFGVMQGTGKVVVPTPSVTPSLTPTATMSPTATATATPEATWTPLPPYEYTVVSGDSCIGIAAFYKVSVTSIVAINANLTAACDNLFPGQKILIPQPTLTPSPQPSQTLSAAESTDVACEKYDYTVKAGDTLFNIAANFNVSADAIKSYNGLASDTVYEGLPLIIPLCERLPTAGPTPTPTNPPPYPAPNLLLPADGAVFTAANDSVTLQWASVGTLLQNEAFAVTIEDITEGKGRRLTEYVTDTKFIVPASFRPVDSIPHVLKWNVITVRQVGSSIDGKPIYEPAGAVSASRAFVWWSTGGTVSTPTP